MRTLVKSPLRRLTDDVDSLRYILTEPRVGYRMPKGETRE